MKVLKVAFCCGKTSTLIGQEVQVLELLNAWNLNVNMDYSN
jgi:hypothetical protein